MIILLIIAVWIAYLSLVVGLCAAARVGDGDGGRSANARWALTQPPLWDAAGSLEVSARAGLPPSRTGDSPAPALRSGGVAA